MSRSPWIRTMRSAGFLVLLLPSLSGCGGGGGGGGDATTNPVEPPPVVTAPALTVTGLAVSGTVAPVSGHTVSVVIDGITVPTDAGGTWQATIAYDGTPRTVVIRKLVDGVEVSTRTLVVAAQP